MKAAVYDRYGPPEAVRIRDVEKPSPKGSSGSKSRRGDHDAPVATSKIVDHVRFFHVGKLQHRPHRFLGGGNVGNVELPFCSLWAAANETLRTNTAKPAHAVDFR